MTSSVKFLPVIGAVAAMTMLSSAAAAAHSRGPTLVGRAVLAAEATAVGPPSGAALVPAPPQSPVINGIAFPRPSQPVIGFSAIVDGRRPGEYLAMPDNGYGAKGNSADFLIRAYYIEPDFKTARKGSGNVKVRNFVPFSDPDHRLGFPIVNENSVDRLLTGADIDPESLQRGRQGDFWMGDEFGPWLLHFDKNGVLLDPPYALPDGLMSPNNPFLAGAATQPNSRGLEALAITPNGKYLYAMLEGATVADGTSHTRLVFEFSVGRKAFTDRRWSLRTESTGNFVADAWALDSHRMVVIERDGGLGLNALFRGVYVVDLRGVGADGYVRKQLAVDLTNIADPNLISLPERHPGDVGLGNPFRVVCESVEAVHVVSRTRLLVGCDNNLPNTGRNPGRADDSEFIVIDVPSLGR